MLFLKNKIEEYITFNGHSNITSTYVDDENFLLGRRGLLF